MAASSDSETRDHTPDPENLHSQSDDTHSPPKGSSSAHRKGKLTTTLPRSVTAGEQNLLAIMKKHGVGVPRKTTDAAARKETNSGFRPTKSFQTKGSSSGKAGPSTSTSMKMLRLGKIVVLVCGLETNESGALILRNTQYPNAEAVETMFTYGLAVASDDSEALAFGAEWDQRQIDKWLRSEHLFATLFDFLDLKYPDESLHWMLLKKDRSSLVVMKRPEHHWSGAT
ncbi:hypothetical protein C8F01DRAFT_443495 [Mycena amicta]|nr:hypothetical protein C8F01DRAFT_443495 [Mycena amicta]